MRIVERNRIIAYHIFMKILVTGAHFTPALATIEEQKKMTPGVRIVYVGRKNTMEGDQTQSIESKVLPLMGVKFISIITGRLQRHFSIYTIISLLKIPVGFLQAFYILFSEKPDVILSFGGYVAVPVVIIGWLFSIPIIVHEQTLVSGISNKLGSIFADKVALSFKEHPSYGKDRTILTGNPVRMNITQGVKLSHPGGVLPRILIMGGNQGSHVINLVVEGVLDKLTKISTIVHITGNNKFDDFERLEKKQNNRYIVKQWIENLGEVLEKSNLVVCRAGINTLVELAILGKMALVIPIPYIYNDEQNKNAKYFESLGLVKILPQSKFSSATLLSNIKEMLADKNSKEKVKGAKKAIVADGAKRLALETLLLFRRG